MQTLTTTSTNQLLYSHTKNFVWKLHFRDENTNSSPGKEMLTGNHQEFSRKSQLQNLCTCCFSMECHIWITNFQKKDMHVQMNPRQNWSYFYNCYGELSKCWRWKK